MPALPYLNHQPSFGDGVHLAEDAYVTGATTIAGPARFLPSSVARGDQNSISIGPRFRIGQGSTIHVDSHSPTRIGADVWIGKGCVVHGCTLGDGVRVEDGGLVLSGSSVGAGSVVAADSLVPEGASFPENSYVEGTPGRHQRDTTPEEREETRRLVAEATGVGRQERST